MTNVFTIDVWNFGNGNRLLRGFIYQARLRSGMTPFHREKSLKHRGCNLQNAGHILFEDKNLVAEFLSKKNQPLYQPASQVWHPQPTSSNAPFFPRWNNSSAHRNEQRPSQRRPGSIKGGKWRESNGTSFAHRKCKPAQWVAHRNNTSRRVTGSEVWICLGGFFKVDWLMVGNMFTVNGSWHEDSLEIWWNMYIRYRYEVGGEMSQDSNTKWGGTFILPC